MNVWSLAPPSNPWQDDLSYIKKFLVFACSFFILYSCSSSREEVSPGALVQYISNTDNGLKASVEQGPYRLEVAHRPSDLFIYQEADRLELDSATFKKLSRKYNSNYYFILSISKNKHEALNAGEMEVGTYSQILETLAFRMEGLVSLVTAERDTISVRDFMLDRTYGTASATNIIFSFDKARCRDKKWIEFTMDEVGLGIGPQKFRFHIEDLESVPRLKFLIESNI